MRRPVGLICVLLLFSVFCHGATNRLEDPATSVEKKQKIHSLAKSILKALETYENAERDLCVAELTDGLNVALVKDVMHAVPKNCMVDSLVVGNDTLARWGYLKAVDLGYLKDVEAVFTIKTSASQELAQTLANMLQHKGFDLTAVTASTYEFKDLHGGYVEDNRFKVKTRSYIGCRYTYRIETVEDYLIFDVREVVSDHWLTETSAKSDQRGSVLASN